MRPGIPGSHVLFPILMRHRRGVTSVRNIVFATYGSKKVKLDIVKADDARPGEGRPGVLQIHGGGWVIGDKREQGIPLLQPPRGQRLGRASTPTTGLSPRPRSPST